MFEFEVDHRSAPADLPADVLARFAEASSTIEAASVIAWEEHCTECAMPQCYATCDLYTPRKDGKCRRFEGGFERLRDARGSVGPIARISFKRWGQIMAYANTRLFPAATAQTIERAAVRIDSIAARVPDGSFAIAGRRGLSSRLQRRAKQWLSHSAPLVDPAARPDAFLIEAYNPGVADVRLTLTMRDVSTERRAVPFQHLVVCTPGFSRIRIPFDRIASHVDGSSELHVTLCPNAVDDGNVTLYFGTIAFVRERTDSRARELPAYVPAELTGAEKHVKVVAWDLDNTLWQGILVEDGESGIRLREEVAAVVKALDARGIVNSVISKNDAAAVEPVLRRLGLDEYFVFSKVGWGPKSTSMAELIADFNVGADTVAYVDDSPFERAEVAASCPGVRIYAETEAAGLASLPAFRPPLSAESSKRREFYRAEERRVRQRAAFGSNYETFLRSCAMHAVVERADDSTAARVHELIQRTNQLNFSGTRYDRDAVARLLVEPGVLPLSISCSDRFGDYGLVGFCVLEADEATVRDLMFSCRVQAKRVEHAVLGELMRFLQARGADRLRVRYRPTARNAQAAKVFDDMGFSDHAFEHEPGVRMFEFSLREPPPGQDLVAVDWRVR